jgi:hypothetical protein
MNKVQRLAVALSVVGMAVVLVVAPWVHAQGDALAANQILLAEKERADQARVMEARRLVDSILEQRQTLSGRRFGPGYRETVMRSLVGVPIETLRRIEGERGEGDLRSAIEAARTADLADGGAPDDFLPLPARLTEPSAVSGVAQSGSVFVPVTPCRIADTRLAVAGALVPGAARPFVVTGNDAALFTAQGGNASGCGIPAGTAIAAFVNFVSVSPVGPGNLRSWAYAATPPPPPSASILNYAAVPGSLNIANGVTAPLCDPLVTTCNYDILAQAFGSETHVIADVLGYFRIPPTSFATLGRSFSTTTVAGTCTGFPGAIVFVDVPAPGRVLVQTTIQLRIDHTVNTLETVVTGIGDGPTDCSSPDAVMARMLAEPTAFYFPTVTPSRLFLVSTPGSYYYYVTGFASGTTLNDQFWRAQIQATYHPD